MASVQFQDISNLLQNRNLLKHKYFIVCNETYALKKGTFLTRDILEET